MNLIHVHEQMLFYAFRYALGRRTYVVGDVVNSLVSNWVLLDLSTQKQIIKEIYQAIEKDEAGSKVDVEEWQKILNLFDVMKDTK